MDKAKINLLIVDDEPGLCAGLQEALRRTGYDVEAATDPLAALKLIEARLFNLVISDIKMPGLSGLEFLTQVKQRSPDTLGILMTAYGTVESAVAAMKEGVYDYLTKPIDLKRLRAVVQKALEFQAVVTENHELRRRLQKRSEPSLLISQSEAMRAILRLIHDVALSDVTVLIEGESGTGKELVARAIHSQSARSAQPFVTVNCAAVPEPLAESELFGHVKGAFTGAMANKPGRFQLADRGTLFLDEISDLPPKGQGDLLRVLEEGCFRMVGGTDLVRVDVRVIAATNKNLQQAVAAGKFREDLFYRLQIVPVVLPPLRERPEDIPLLIESFLEHFSAKHKRRRKTLARESMDLFQQFPWPGNVRQVRNLVERLVITCPGSVINPEDLPDFVAGRDQQTHEFTVRPGMTLAEVDKLLIRKTLAHISPQREVAAKALGISRRTLQYKLKKYGLAKERHKAEDGGRKTEDGRPKTEGGRRRTEDRRRKTQDGRPKTEDAGRKTVASRAQVRLQRDAPGGR